MREYDPNHRYQVITCASADFTDEDMSFRTVAEARTRISYLVKEYLRPQNELLHPSFRVCKSVRVLCRCRRAFHAPQIPRYARGQHDLLLHLLQRPWRSAFHPLRPVGR